MKMRTKADEEKIRQQIREKQLEIDALEKQLAVDPRIPQNTLNLIEGLIDDWAVNDLPPLKEFSLDEARKMGDVRLVCWLAAIITRLELGEQPRCGGHEDTEYLAAVALGYPHGYDTWRRSRDETR
jgi:hypothetical protein